jgi:xylose isomerase
MRRVIFRWKAIKEIIADRLIKALPKQRYKSFVNIIGMVDIKERLNGEKQLEDLREKVRARRKDSNEITVQLTH